MTYNFREARIARGVTLRAIARKVGVTAQTIYNYERGRTQPDLKKFRAIKKLLALPGELEDWFPAKPHVGDSPCSHKGCDKDAVSRGLCMKHYVTWWRRRRRAEQQVETMLRRRRRRSA